MGEEKSKAYKKYFVINSTFQYRICTRELHCLSEEFVFILDYVRFFSIFGQSIYAGFSFSPVSVKSNLLQKGFEIISRTYNWCPFSP